MLASLWPRNSCWTWEQLDIDDPTNAGWKRDLWVSCWKMADIAEKTANPESQQWRQRAYEVLSSMKTRGLYLSPQDEGVLAQLRQIFGD